MKNGKIKKHSKLKNAVVNRHLCCGALKKALCPPERKTKKGKLNCASSFAWGSFVC
jgi:hypothetical protein